MRRGGASYLELINVGRGYIDFISFGGVSCLDFISFTAAGYLESLPFDWVSCFDFISFEEIYFDFISFDDVSSGGFRGFDGIIYDGVRYVGVRYDDFIPLGY